MHSMTHAVSRLQRVVALSAAAGFSRDHFLYDLLRFAVTIVFLALIILWARGSDPTPDAPASTAATDQQ